MAEPFLGEVRLFSFSFPPKGWALCNGQLLNINQNQALFSLMGTTYGGDGRTNFALPDLRGRTPIYFGAGHVMGERAGVEAVTLNISQLPTHSHQASVSNQDTDTPIPSNVNPIAAIANGYRQPADLTGVAGDVISNTGGSQAHSNMQPYLTIGFCVALQGIFPSQT